MISIQIFGSCFIAGCKILIIYMLCRPRLFPKSKFLISLIYRSNCVDTRTRSRVGRVDNNRVQSEWRWFFSFCWDRWPAPVRLNQRWFLQDHKSPKCRCFYEPFELPKT